MKLEGLNFKDITLTLRRATQPIAKHHVTIAFVLVIGTLIFAILTVNTILTQPADTNYLAEKQSDTVKARFDEATIKRIDDLYHSKERIHLSSPQGPRPSPFTE